MKKQIEKSCGAVVFMRREDGVRYVVIENLGGVAGFPKGHVEAGESETQTALREIYEEVRLRPRLWDGFREIDEHPIPGRDVIKRIVYFLAEYDGAAVPVRQKTEVSRVSLLTFDEALAALRFDRIKQILRAADAFIRRETANG